jgi:hypothetical protein
MTWKRGGKYKEDKQTVFWVARSSNTAIYSGKVLIAKRVVLLKRSDHPGEVEEGGKGTSWW